MSSPPISDLTAVEALEQAITASQLLLKELANFESFEEKQLEKTNKLAQVRDQLVHQAFACDWSEDEVAKHHDKLSKLEALNTQLVEKAEEVRYDLHQQRVDNQQGRKAVSAYGTAKSQFYR